MSKRKSGQQIPNIPDVRNGQGNLMLDAKQGVACSNHAGPALQGAVSAQKSAELLFSPQPT